MNSFASAFPDERSSSMNLSLSNLFEPIADELAETISLYRETVLRTAERNYLHTLISGGVPYLPEEFRIATADRIAEHLLESDGKWIRSALVLLTANACGFNGLPARQVAAAVEMIHMATLVHDDIIDEAPMRRGVEAVHWHWGNSIAVLLGDFLFSKAFKLLLASGSLPSQSLLTQATGQMCLGEIKELVISDQGLISEKDYMEMIENKTASLMAAASASGAHLGGLDSRLAECMHAYGHAVGIAFQITDDVLDFTAPTSILGKEQGWDMRNGKTTLPLIHLLHNDGVAARGILESSQPFEEKAARLLSLMNEMGSIDYAYDAASRYGAIAKNNLAEVEKVAGSSHSIHSLNNLVDFILIRER
ncbi:MAG: polyprenyl synthetase family protein [Candidatus Omnitrophota bacterium]